MGEDDIVTREDIEDILNFHRVDPDGASHVEQLAATINYALDKFLSKLIDKMKEEEG